MCGRRGGNPILKFLGSGGLCLIKAENLGVKFTKCKSGEVLHQNFKDEFLFMAVIVYLMYNSCPLCQAKFLKTFVSNLQTFLNIDLWHFLKMYLLNHFCRILQSPGHVVYIKGKKSLIVL